MKSSVLDGIKKSAAVPSMPQVVLRFLEIMQDPEFDYRHVVKALSTDPGTVSEVLRLANSALFGVRNKVVSVKQALTLLGPKRVRSLLLGRYLVDTMSKKRVAGLDMNYFWRRSLASSVIASHFAGRLLPQQRDEAFIAALLADIGIPILAEALPKAYRSIIAQYMPNGRATTADDERKAVEVTHGEVSAMVLAHWTLPENVANAVNLHQSEHPGEGAVATIARILNGSDQIARLLCETAEQPDAAATCQKATEFCGLGLSVLHQLLPTIQREIEELADALRIDVVTDEAYALMIKNIEEALHAPAAG